MAQLTVYIDDETLAKVERSARMANISISRWVREKLSEIVATEWPDGFFDLFGSLSEGDLDRPAQPAANTDLPRESL